jgi:hypothetical protein
MSRNYLKAAGELYNTVWKALNKMVIYKQMKMIVNVKLFKHIILNVNDYVNCVFCARFVLCFWVMKNT